MIQQVSLVLISLIFNVTKGLDFERALRENKFLELPTSGGVHGEEILSYPNFVYYYLLIVGLF